MRIMTPRFPCILVAVCRVITSLTFTRYVFPEGIVEEMTFTVAAGKPIYVGVVAITERHGVAVDRPAHTWTFNQKDYKDTVEFRPEPAAEAWERAARRAGR